MDVGTATPIMMPRLKALILRLLHEHRVMTMATLRPDGWPQATMVGYVNDGFFLYCFVARSTQKFANIQRDPRVSIAIGSDARKSHAGARLVARRARKRGQRPIRVRRDCRAAAAKVSGIRRFACAAGAARWASAHRAGAKAHAVAFCASHRTSSRCWTTSTASATASSLLFRNAISMCISRPCAIPGTRSTISAASTRGATDVSDCCRARALNAGRTICRAARYRGRSRSCCCGRAGAAPDCAPMP